MEVPSESLKGELGIQEPVILCEPQFITVNRCGSPVLCFFISFTPRSYKEDSLGDFLKEKERENGRGNR